MVLWLCLTLHCYLEAERGLVLYWSKFVYLLTCSMDDARGGRLWGGDYPMTNLDEIVLTRQLLVSLESTVGFEKIEHEIDWCIDDIVSM